MNATNPKIMCSLIVRLVRFVFFVRHLAGWIMYGFLGFASSHTPWELHPFRELQSTTTTKKKKM